MKPPKSITKLAGIFLLAVIVLAEVVYGSSGADGSATIIVAGKTVVTDSTPLSIKEIESIGISSVSILDPFEKTQKSYQGVWLDQFVEKFGTPDVATVVFTGIDDYQVSFTKDEWCSTRILLATRDNQHYVDFDKKGPLRVIFPDYDPSIHNSKEVLPKWIWMITRIAFK